MYLVLTVSTLCYLLPVWCLGVGSSHAEKELNTNNSLIVATVIAITNDTSKQKNSTDPQPHVKDQSGDSDSENKIAANIAISVITIVIVVMILVMSVYFIRKFQQLSRFTPSYRYSSLKTEINGIDDKAETQALVSVSTDEDDYDDEELLQ